MRQFINALASGGGGAVQPPESVTLYDSDLSSLPSGWVNNGFTDTGSGLSISGTGSMATNFYLNQQIWLNDVKFTLTFTLDDVDTRMALGHDMQGGRGTDGGIFTMDWENNLLKYGTNPDDGSEPTVLLSTTLTNVTKTQDESYTMELSRLDDVLTCRIYNVNSPETYDEIEHDYAVSSTHVNMLRGFTTIFHFTGAYTATAFTATSLVQGFAHVGFFGDSITEGRHCQLDGGTLMDSFGRKVKTANSGSAYICAQGGGKTEELRDQVEWLVDYPALVPSHAVVLIGTNDRASTSAFTNNIDAIITALENAGANVTICTVPPASSSQSGVNTINAYISGLSTYGELDTALVLSGSNADSVTQDATLFYDTLHPNVDGNLDIYNEIVNNNSYLITP